MADKGQIIKEAQKYILRGQVDRAIAEWEKILKDYPDGNVYNTVGDLYLKKGDNKRAIDYYVKSASFFRSEGFLLKAIAIYKKIINLNPSDAASFIALAELSEEKGLITDATKYYLAASDILIKENKKSEIVDIYKKIISLQPSNIPLRDKIASLFLREGLIYDAVREYIDVARHYKETDNPEEAKKYLEKALEINPSDREGLKYLAELMDQMGNTGEALTYIKRVIKAYPDDSESLIACANFFKKLGKYEESLNYISKAIELDPERVELWEFRGGIYLLLNDRLKAWDSFKKVVDSQIKENRIDEAIEIVEEFRDVVPLEVGKLQISLFKAKGDTEREFQSLLFVADLLDREGQPEEALELYREALQIYPDDPNLKRLIAKREIKLSEGEEKSYEELLADADIFVKYNLIDEAKTILEDLKVKDPMNVEVHERLKSLYIETGDKEQAVTECLILSEIFGRRGELDKKEAYLREAININPDDPRLKERLDLMWQSTAGLDDYSEELAEAEFYLRQGFHEEALRIYEKLLKILPDNEEILNKVSVLQGNFSGQTSEVQEGIKGETVVNETVETNEIVEPQLEIEPQFDREVSSIFEEFKKGLEKEVEPQDMETHYNLGIAYREMGLLDDAISEFQISRNDTRFFVKSMTMLGFCYMEKGLYPIAIKSFKEALANIETRDESYWDALYELATAYEKSGDTVKAFELYTEIYRWDSKFRGIEEKLNQLKGIIEKERQKIRKDRISYL